ncbi:MAG: MarR family transcriptional regulator [Roseiflexaceae bacterium]
MLSNEDNLMLYHRFQQIYVLIDDGDRRILRNVGLTPTQYNLLLQLGEHADEGLTITALSQVLLCTRGNVTRLVRRMEQQGLVRCTSDSRDLRLVRVSLTPGGAARIEEARTLHNASIGRRFSALPDHERAALVALTQSVAKALTDDLETLGSPPPAPSDDEE